MCEEKCVMPSAAYTNSDGYISKVHRVDYNQTVVRGITCVSAVRSANNIPTKNKPSANRLVTTNPVVLKVFFIFSPSKPKDCRFHSPPKKSQKANCKNVTLPNVKKQCSKGLNRMAREGVLCGRQDNDFSEFSMIDIYVI